MFRKKYAAVSDPKTELANYVRLGGFPATHLQAYSQDKIYTIVRDIYNSTIFSDIVKRNQNRKIDQLERVVKYTFNNIGNTFSALTQLGNEGGQPYWSWYGFDSREEWCACFVSWCADQCGYIESGLIPKFIHCVDGENWFKSNNQWYDRNYEPKAGDIIFFDWEGDGVTDHVGIVEKCENGTVYTVEGNSGDTCKQNSYTIGSSVIYGYGTPAY